MADGEAPEDVLQGIVAQLDGVLREFAEALIRAEATRIVEVLRTSAQGVLADFIATPVEPLRSTSAPETAAAADEPKAGSAATDGDAPQKMGRADAARVLEKEPKFKKRGSVYGDLARLERKGLIKAHGKGRSKTIDLDEARSAMDTLVAR